MSALETKIKLSNDEFMKAIFSQLHEDESNWVTAFTTNPNNAGGQNWKGWALLGEANAPSIGNTYFSTSSLKQHEGAIARSKQYFSRLFCVVLDDPQDCVINPTWKLETSQNNFQIGFKLDKPIADIEIASRLISELAANGMVHVDNSGNNVVRYVRLAIGTNSKHTPPFPHIMHVWEPNKTFSLKQLCRELRLNLEYILSGDMKCAQMGKSLTQSATPKKPDDELIQEIISGENWHEPINILVARYVSRGLKEAEITKIMEGLMLKANDGSERWKSRYADIPRSIRGAIEKFSPGPGFKSPQELIAARRAHQKKENERIGEYIYAPPIAEVITLDDATERFVFVADGSRVVDLFNPIYDLSLSDWINRFAASKHEILSSSLKPVTTTVSAAWKTSPKRMTVITKTFKAGGAIVENDPNEKIAINTWKPFDRDAHPEDYQNSDAGRFVEHIHYLFGDDGDRFLDWLAHIEQHPEQLPHTAWLHISKHVGTGRNWIESVLVRLWPGYVAANFDLVSTLKNGFNERLSRKLLVVVDEIREGGRDSRWEHSEKLKSLITEETRTINQKYGRMSIEYNACRWLMFSNHTSAIPIPKEDRRLEVSICKQPPKDQDYYIELYALLDDSNFINSITQLLGQRDISGFNPGAHAKYGPSKRIVVNASQNETAEWCELIKDHWPGELITNEELKMILEEGSNMTKADQHTLDDFHITPFRKAIRVGPNRRPQNIRILRNHEHWESANPDEVRSELEKSRQEIASKAGGLVAPETLRNFLKECAADEGEAEDLI